MKKTALTLAIGMLSTSASAHEVWISPADYQVQSGKSTSANILNGEKFDGSTIYFNPDRTIRLDRTHKDKVSAIPGRLGDEPAIRLPALPDGLHVLAYQSTPSTLLYRKWAKFAKFAAHKDFKNIQSRHRERRLPDEQFRELYTRYAKALIAVGSGAGADRATGLETEIVALANPYTTKQSRLPVRVLFKGKPRANAQIELFEKAPDDTVTVTLHRTNTAGESRLPIKPGHRYLVDAVVLRAPVQAAAEEHDAVWETLWAALTFAVPD